jgi:hypothetical protein
MLQVLQVHVAGVVLQEDVALKAYVAILCFNYFKCFKSMLQVLQAHVAGVVCYKCCNNDIIHVSTINNLAMFQYYITDVAAIILYMFHCML